MLVRVAALRIWISASAAALVLAAGVSAVPLAIALSRVHRRPGDPRHHQRHGRSAAIRRHRRLACRRTEFTRVSRERNWQPAQRAAYPDIQPLVVGRPRREVVELASAVAEELGWRIVAVDPDGGLLEATDTTFWFGFKDDVAVRLRSAAAGATRVDVRSISRVGGGRSRRERRADPQVPGNGSKRPRPSADAPVGRWRRPGRRAVLKRQPRPGTVACGSPPRRGYWTPPDAASASVARAPASMFGIA